MTNAAALADDNTQQIAHRLGSAIESSTRLAIIEALSDAAETISAELAPASVEVRMSGQNPEFVVNVPEHSSDHTLLQPPPDEAVADESDYEDGPVARVTLRLPSSVKTKVDELAAADGISTNAWLVRAVVDAIADRRRRHVGPPIPPVPPVPPGFGGGGPFGPGGVFVPGGAFGPGGVFGSPEAGREDRRAGRRGDHAGRSGSVQGWVR